jgi:hypothetical protein
METITASPISEIDAMQITDDGMHMLLHVKDGNGRPIVLAFPHDQLKAIVTCCAQAKRNSDLILKADPLASGVFDTDACSIVQPADTKDAVMTVTIEGSGRLSFFVDDSLLRPMYETLRQRFEGK